MDEETAPAAMENKRVEAMDIESSGSSGFMPGKAEETAPAAIENERIEAIDIESRILELCKTYVSGVSDSFLKTALPSVDPSQRVSSLNRLISQGKLEVLKRNKEIVYKLKDPNIVTSNKGADNEEKIVYQIIEKATNKGIWVRDIRFQSHLSLTQVNKILKSLEGKKLIKSVKPVNASKKKMYMLYDLEPDNTVTGGTWYTDQEFETEFVEVLNMQSLRFLQQAGQTTQDADPLSARRASSKSLKEVWEYINCLGISKVQLKIDDIEAILNSLIYDDKITMTPSTSGDKQENLYRAKSSNAACAGLMKVPCGVCRLIDDCKEGNVISPSKCQYMKEWLEENF